MRGGSAPMGEGTGTEGHPHRALCTSPASCLWRCIALAAAGAAAYLEERGLCSCGRHRQSLLRGWGACSS